MRKLSFRSIAVLALGFCSMNLQIHGQAEDPIFSGPLPGEKATPFTVRHLIGEQAGTERNVLSSAEGKPVTLVFLHNVERSMLPLLRVIDVYGATLGPEMTVEVILLTADMTAAQTRVPAMNNSLKLSSPMTVSVDGLEGPGNYGLNKNCLMTVLVVKDGKVTGNFAMIQPGIADAPKIVAAMAKAAGKDEVPDLEALMKEHAPGMARQMQRRERIAEGDRGGNEERRAAARGEEGDARPSDPALGAALRAMIQGTPTEAQIDGAAEQLRKLLAEQPSLKKQAIRSLTAISERGYGTEHAQTTARALLNELKPKER